VLFLAYFGPDPVGKRVAITMGMMRKIFAIATLSLCTLALAAPSQAQHTRGSAPARGGAVVRGGGGGAGVRSIGPVFRGGFFPRYYYPRFSFGFYAGYPFYSPYYYPYGYYGSVYGYPYGYPYYGGGYYGGGYYGNSDEARGLGGLRIKDAPEHAQVFADGYYAGEVDDFDGTFQHLDLPEGAHHIEIRDQGRAAIQFDVNVVPGETITYHAK
jgi:hypothetical protein